VQRAAGRPLPVDAAVACRQAGGTQGGGLDLARGGAAGAEKNELKPHQKKMWCIPPKQSAEFVYHLEDVLEVYKRPYDPKRPVVCLDETFKQLIGETREPLPPRPGHVERFDHVYTRNGVPSLFAAFEPLRGRRQIAVTDRRRRLEWAQFVRALVDGAYRRAEKVVLVMDQLNTHSAASLYEAFPPASTDRHTVKPWFLGKLDFSPDVVDLAHEGFPLVGGRLDYLEGHTVAALVYRRQSHAINLFTWPIAGEDAGPTIITHRGFNIRRWRCAGMTYWAISDLNGSELDELVRLLCDRLKAASISSVHPPRD